MKINKIHYIYMRDKMAPVIQADPLIFKKYKDKGLSQKRLRWDAMHSAGLLSFVCDELYPYLNDNHIDTALRSIIKQLSTTSNERGI